MRDPHPGRAPSLCREKDELVVPKWCHRRVTTGIRRVVSRSTYFPSDPPLFLRTSLCEVLPVRSPASLLISGLGVRSSPGPFVRSPRPSVFGGSGASVGSSVGFGAIGSEDPPPTGRSSWSTYRAVGVGSVCAYHWSVVSGYANRVATMFAFPPDRFLSQRHRRYGRSRQGAAPGAEARPSTGPA